MYGLAAIATAKLLNPGLIVAVDKAASWLEAAKGFELRFVRAAAIALVFALAASAGE